MLAAVLACLLTTIVKRPFTFRITRVGPSPSCDNPPQRAAGSQTRAIRLGAVPAYGEQTYPVGPIMDAGKPRFRFNPLRVIGFGIDFRSDSDG